VLTKICKNCLQEDAILSNPDAKNEIMKKIAESLKSISEEEKHHLKDLKSQVEQTVKNNPDTDKQLEFCYSVVFSPDKIKDEKLISSAREYINLVENI
jgi:rubrerythrin